MILAIGQIYQERRSIRMQVTKIEGRKVTFSEVPKHEGIAAINAVHEGYQVDLNESPCEWGKHLGLWVERVERSCAQVLDYDECDVIAWTEYSVRIDTEHGIEVVAIFSTRDMELTIDEGDVEVLPSLYDLWVKSDHPNKWVPGYPVQGFVHPKR